MTAAPDTHLDEKPAYQSMDVILAGPRITELSPPTPGYVVTFPDNGLDAVMLTEEESTPERLEELKALSKWPDFISYRKAWLHSQEVVRGAISNRKCWTPR